MKSKAIIFIKVAALLISAFFISLGIVILALKFQVESQIAFKMFGMTAERYFESLSWQSARTIYEIMFQACILFVFGYLANLILSLDIRLALITFLVANVFLRNGLTINDGMTLLNSTFLIFMATLFFYLGYKISMVKAVNKSNNAYGSDA